MPSSTLRPFAPRSFALPTPILISLVRRLGGFIVFGAARGAGALPLSPLQEGTGGGRTGTVGAWVVALGRRQLEQAVETGGGATGEMGRREFLLTLFTSIFFVLLGGVFSGLSLGLMGLDSMKLHVLASSGPPAARSDAQKVLKLLSHGRHFVLCTLLLSNVVVDETLPIFLDSLTEGPSGGFLAVLISSAAIVIFGEVLPQALCAQHGLKIGARCVGFVRFLMYLEAPVNWPVARLLDFLLGTHSSTLFRREELLTLISMHSDSSSLPEASGYAPLEDEKGVLTEVEVNLVKEVLGFGGRTAGEAVKEKEREKGTYWVKDGMRVCEVDLKEILLKSQHYVPVQRSRSFSSLAEKGSEKTFIGFLSVQQIADALARPNELVRSLPLSPLIRVHAETPLTECLAYCRNENPDAVLLVVALQSEDSAVSFDGAPPVSPLGFLTLPDLASLLIRPTSTNASSTPTSSAAVEYSRNSTSHHDLPATRPRSSSVGLGSFVKNLVDRQLASAVSIGRARGHRASSSQLSFQLSSDDNDGDEEARYSISHHRRTTSSSLSMRSLPSSFRPPLTASSATGAASALNAVSSEKGNRPSPVFEEETEQFSLGCTDDELSSVGEGGGGRSRSGSLAAQGGRQDDSGFADDTDHEGEGEGQEVGKSGVDVMREKRDPLGARGEIG